MEPWEYPPLTARVRLWVAGVLLFVTVLGGYITGVVLMSHGEYLWALMVWLLTWVFMDAEFAQLPTWVQGGEWDE